MLGRNDVTLALVLAAEILVVIIGLPLGILGRWNDLAQNIMGPVLDVMQTMPAFVYLVPSVISTVIFAFRR